MSDSSYCEETDVDASSSSDDSDDLEEVLQLIHHGGKPAGRKDCDDDDIELELAAIAESKKAKTSFEQAAETIRLMPDTPPRQLVNMVNSNHQYMKKRAILCAYMRRYYFDRYVNSRLLTVEDIQADAQLYDTYEKAVDNYTKDGDITMTQIAEKYGIHQSVFRAYISETLPGFANIKRACKPIIEEAITTIHKDPKLKAKYDKAIELYVNCKVSSLTKAANKAGVKLTLFKIYLQQMCPNYQDIRVSATTKRYYESLPSRDIIEKYKKRLQSMMGQENVKYIRKQRDGSSYCEICLCRIRGQKMSDMLDHYDSAKHQDALKEIGDDGSLVEQPVKDPEPVYVDSPPLPAEQHVIIEDPAPKDNVGPGENSWAAQTSQAAMPSTSRSKEMSPRPSTSATHTGGFLIKQDPGTPPPVQQQVMNPYIQEPPMVQSAPRLLPKPTAPPPQPQVMQQQPRLRIRQPQHHVPPQPAPPDPEPQQVCLRWNSFHNNMQTMFPTLLNKEKFVDVTLACEGQTVKCHKVVLSSCSAYIERLLTENPCKHPIILMPNTMRYWQIRALVDFMYRGEVNVEHEQLSSLLAAAEFLQVKGLAGPPTSPEQNTNIEDPEPEPPLSPRPKRKRVASPSPVPQHRQPVAAPPTPQPQQQQRTSLPNSPAVSITRLKQTPSAAQATPSTSRDTGSRAQSPGIEITPVVSFEEIKMEPIDISDSNDESMDPNMHCDVDYDMDNGDGDADKDYDDEDLDDDSGDVGRGEDDTGGREGDPGPSLQPSSDDQPGTSKTTSNGPDLTTPGFSGNGIEIDDSAASYCAADLGLTTEPPEDPPDSGPGPSGL